MKKKKFSTLTTILIVFFFIFVLSNLFGNRFRSFKTVFPTLTNYEDVLAGKSYNIYREKVYEAMDDGVIVYNAGEGQKVSKGYDIANINLMIDSSYLKDDLIKVNAAISYKKTNGQMNEYSDVKGNEILKNIQRAIRDKSFKSVTANINELDMNAQHNFSYTDLKELIELDLDQLIEKRNSLMEQISTNDIKYLADFSGIVSYEMDGLEEFYTNQDPSIYTWSYLEGHKVPQKFELTTKVSKDAPIFKLIDNLSWDIAVMCDTTKSVNELDEGKTLFVDLNQVRYKGVVQKVNTTPEGSVIVLKMNSFFDDFYKERINDVKLIFAESQSYELPASAIVDRDGVTGVYVQEIHGLVRFLPVQVISTTDNKVSVAIGDKRGMIKIGDKEQRSVTINDSVVVDQSKVPKGQVLN